MKYKTLIALRAVTNDQLVDIALRMAEKHPATFENILLASTPVGEETKIAYHVPGTNETVYFTFEQEQFLKALGTNRKIECIKAIREYTGLMLKEAKDLCEAAFISH